jgi:signal transduction histidine kinase
MLDITDRKQAEQSLAQALEAEKEAREAAERAVRIKSLFLASVSHEIRTPLSALISLAQAMCLESEQHQLPPEFVVFLDRVRSGGNYLNLILSNLLDISASEFGHAPVRDDHFYLFDWVNDLKNILDPISRAHRITLVWHLPADTEVRLRTDQTRLTQILLNLAHNAIKFSGGEERTVIISLQTTSGDLVISVSDEGPGVPPERLPGLFGEFAQSEAVGPAFDRGIGLGLAVVMQNAQLLGGRVRAENLTPHGIRVIVYLPS